MKQHQVWIEGYRATGESGGARFLGTYEAETFAEAVEMALDANNMDRQGFFNAERLTYWGCKFYDNGNDAVSTFG